MVLEDTPSELPVRVEDLLDWSILTNDFSWIYDTQIQYR